MRITAFYIFFLLNTFQAVASTMDTLRFAALSAYNFNQSSSLESLSFRTYGINGVFKDSTHAAVVGIEYTEIFNFRNCRLDIDYYRTFNSAYAHLGLKMGSAFNGPQFCIISDLHQSVLGNLEVSIGYRLLKFNEGTFTHIGSGGLTWYTGNYIASLDMAIVDKRNGYMRFGLTKYFGRRQNILSASIGYSRGNTSTELVFVNEAMTIRNVSISAQLHLTDEFFVKPSVSAGWLDNNEGLNTFQGLSLSFGYKL